MANVLSTHDQRAALVGERGDGLDVEAAQQRVGRRLQPHQPGVGGPVARRARRRRAGRRPSTRSVRVHLGDQPERAAVGVVAEQHPIAGREQAQHVVLGGEPAGEGQPVAGALERGDARLERGAGGVAAARVLEALVAADAVLGERRAQRDRGDHRAGRRVGRLAGVDGAGLEAPARSARRAHPCDRSRRTTSKYASRSVRVSTLNGRPPDEHQQRRATVEHLHGQLDRLADADRRQLRAHHLLDRGVASPPGRGASPPSARARRPSRTPRRRRTAACSCTPAAG